MKLSFIIPCYNSEKSIELVVDEIIKTVNTLSKYDYEIILIDDCSPDNTLNKIIYLCKTNKKLKGLSLSQNFGQPSAMLAGQKFATGDIVVHSDDDGQTPLDELYKLLNKLEEGFDMVFANFLNKKNSAFQNIGSSINNIMAYYLIGKPRKVHMGNFWVCRKFVIDEAVKNNNPHPYIAGIFLSITKNIGTVDTQHRSRIYGRTNYNFKKMLSLWLNGFTAFSIKPLRIASLLGLITSSLGFFYILIILYNKLSYPNVPQGYSSIMSVTLFTGGIIMLLLGMIGEYVGRIYTNANQNPQYVIKKEINL